MFIEDDGLSDARKMEATTWLKARIIDWYYENMTHAVIEECERAEFASLNVGLSRAAANSPSGKILFVNSKYKRHAQFFEADNKREEIADSEEPKTSKCQSVFLDDEVITQLWYLPHLTEILVKVTENLSQPNDISELAYENSGIWSKALQLHYLVYDIYNIVQIFAQMIQNNSKNSSAVCQLRVSEFVYNTMGAIKADLTTMGQRVDYNRVLNYLIGKWQFWMLKIRFAISFVKYSLTLNLKEHSLKVLTATASRYSYSNNYLFLDSTTFDYSNFPLLYPQVQISIQVSHAPTHHYFLGLANEKEKNFCSSKIIEVENLMQDFNQYNLTGNFESINKSQVEFIKGNWKLLQARLEYMKLENNGIRILDESGLEDFFRRYKSRVLAEAVKIYCKQGARGSANPLCFLKTEILTNPLRAEVSRIAQVTFDRYQLNVLSEELLRLYTYNCFTAIKCYYEKLSDERSGRLFKSVSLIKPSTTGDANFGFHISEEDYNAKSALLNNFVNDLHAHYSKFLRDNRDSKTNTWKVKDSKTGPFNAELVFMIPKEALNKAIGKMGLELSKYYALRVAEKESFLESLYDRMLEIIKSNERFIEHILKEKNYMVENLKREVRLESSHKISEFLSEMAVLSIELNDLKKLRKVDEKKIRQSITDEYDDLVRELVHELHLMKNRFNEFRNSAVNEVLNIMSDSKKEELSIIVNTMDVSKYIKQQAQNAIEQENISQKFKAENFELKNTLIKIKSMYTLKETALRTSFDKKIRALTEENKQAEEKLWDSYREADARELVLKKQLTKLQKNQINTDVELELSRKRGQEEKTFVESSNHNNNQLGLQQSSVIQQQNQKIQELQEKLTKYEGVNVKLLIHELSEKTRILEELIDDKQYLESCLQDLGYSNLVANRKPPSKSHKNISLRSRPNTASFKSRPTTAKGRLQRSLPEVHFNSAEKKSIYDSLKLKSVSSTSVNQTGNQQQNIMTDAPIVINYIGNETTDAFDSTNIRGSVSDNYRYHKAQVLSVEYIATDEVGEESEPYYPPGNDFRGDSVTAKQDESLRSEIETSLILDHLKNNARIDMDLNIVPNSSIRGSSVIAPVKKLSCNDLFISTKPQERRATSVNSIGNLDRGAPNVRKTAFTANVNETVGCSPKLKVGRPKSAFPNVLRTAGDIPCVPRTAKTNSSDYQIKTSFSKKK
ncbi:hypothetical protein HK099_001239 [Clydaea vesicula]|uniref:Uncharacterized protein n=1 Tax=Clydaea vesicula TaxID=447962 RepID=A0AAD5U569_9FUNG|nr:hypothetical protein HK099_001239 [Clydaea vesicula]